MLLSNVYKPDNKLLIPVWTVSSAFCFCTFCLEVFVFVHLKWRFLASLKAALKSSLNDLSVQPSVYVPAKK